MARYKLPAALAKASITYLGTADKSLWFTDGPFRVVQVKASGASTFYRLPNSARGEVFGFSASMTVGQDGDLYLVDQIERLSVNTTSVYRLSPEGA
jgi:hypothetical protein